jgi:hypothetical protein
MRKFLSLGDGIPLTTVTLLVLSPVLLGLLLVVFYPVFDRSWWADLVLNPAKHAILIFWMLLWLRETVRYALDRELDPDQPRQWTGLARVAELVWATGAGMLLCLAIVVEKDTLITSNYDAVIYIAVGVVILSIVLQWRDRRESLGYGLSNQT